MRFLFHALRSQCGRCGRDGHHERAPWRHRSPASLHRHQYSQRWRRRHTALQTPQIRLREGDRSVRLLQKAGLFFHRVHLLTQCVPRPRAGLPEGPGSGPAERHHRHHSLGRESVCEGRRQDARAGYVLALRVHLQSAAV